MRIITGSAKGTKLKVPHGLNVRPTTDRVKESIFNIIRNECMDAVVLDIFSGTGNLGLEAVSRGAVRAILVDKSLVSIQVITANAVSTKLLEHVKIIKTDVFRALEQFITAGNQFDLVFCDPPYNQGHVEKVLRIFNRGSLLSNQGILIIEHSHHEMPEGEWDKLRLFRSEKYGETVVSFFTGGS